MVSSAARRCAARSSSSEYRRHHAAVRVFELGIQSRQLFLAQPQLFQAAQQIAILLLHFGARVARAMRSDRASERFDARPRERLGASRHMFAQRDRRAAPGRGLDLECVHQAPCRHQPELRLAARGRAADRGLEVGDARSLVGDGDRQRGVASAFFFERELDAAAAAVTNGVARDFGHCGGDANLVLRIEVEQGADLPRALAGSDHVAIVGQLQLQQLMSHDVVRRSATIERVVAAALAVTIQHSGDSGARVLHQPRIAFRLPGGSQPVGMKYNRRRRRDRIAQLADARRGMSDDAVVGRNPLRRVAFDDGRDQVADAGGEQLAPVPIDFHHDGCRAARRAQVGVDALQDRGRRARLLGHENVARHGRRLRRAEPVAEAIDTHDQRAACTLHVAPGVAALDLVRLRHDDGADLHRMCTRCAAARPQLRYHRGAVSGLRIDVEQLGHAADRSQPGARTAAGREAVAQALGHVIDPGPLVEPDEPDAATVAALQRLRDQLPAVAVLDQVAADFHRDQRGAACIFLVEALARCQRRDRAARLRDLTRFRDEEALHSTSSA